LLDANDDVSSTGLICTSCIELENEVLALKQVRGDMSAKLVEHNEMSANLEKENELLRTTYAECIGKEMENLKMLLVVLVIALSLKMRFWLKDARVFVLSLWIHVILATLMLLFLRLLLCNWS